MRLKRQGWTLIGLLVMLLAGPPAMRAQVALTSVQDTIYNADGTAAQGTVLVSWSAFTTAAGNSVAAGMTAATLGAGGSLSISLAPNAGAMPTGSYYTAVFHLTDGTTTRQYWVIPVVAAGGAPVKLSTIQNQVLPTNVAMQTVSRSYVDTAIANALSGGGAASGSSSYVQKSGDTMTGPLVLPGDPVSPLQAADKSYVDTNVAQIAGGLSTKVSTVPAAAQTVVQPAGTQLEVNSLNGVLDASGFLTGNGNNGLANALTSANCTNGCDVHASRTYPGVETVPVGLIPAGGRLQDARGGALNEYFVNPMAASAGGYVGSSWSQVTNASSQLFAAAHPGTAGAAAYLLQLTQSATTGGSNLLPGSRETVPYGKSTYGVLGLTGNYNTQGQHVQFNNFVNCYSVGDCLAGGQFITSAGGYRDEADEGTHPFDLQVAEDYHVFQGTCVSGCTTGSTSLVVNAVAAAGTQGDGRFLIDKNPADVISTGYLSGSGLNLFSVVNFTGTNFAVSQFVQLAQQENSQPGNMAPGLVTAAIMTTGVGTGVATSTAALPASGVACVADIVSTGSFPNFETATYSVVDATHVQLNLHKVHYPGALVGVGGLCGYGIEQTVDTVNAVRQVFPVVGSISPTALYYAGANSGVVGYTGDASTGGYLNESVQITSAVRSGNTVTLTTAGNMPYDFTGLTMTVSGVADSSFNGSFAVTSGGGNTLTYANTGADGSSTGGTVGIVTGGYNLYPMAEVLSVANPVNNAVDGTMILAPNTVPWASGDSVEQPHYHQQLVMADTEVVTQYLPRPVQYSSAGKLYQGTVGPGMRGWQVNNAAPANQYLGAGGTHQPPDDAYLASGVWRNTFEADAGENAVMRIHCNLHGCKRWDAGYALFSMDSQSGQDFLFYYPNANSASWILGGTTYNFSPSTFTAPNINVTTLNGTTVNTGALNATGGSVTGLNGFGLGTPNTVGSFTWQPNGTHQNGNGDPWFGISDGTNYVGLAASLPAPAGTKVVGGYFAGLGIGGATANSNTPIFGVLNSVESNAGLGNVAFTITDSNVVETYRNTLDDGNGNMTVAGKLRASAGLLSGNAGNTDLVGTVVVAAGATSSASYSFTGGYASAPVCMVQPQNVTPAVAQALGGYVAQVSAGTLSVSVGTAPGGSVTFGYTCVARN